MIRALILILLLASCSKKVMPTVTLDGSKSHSSTAIVSYRWYQISGSTAMVFDNPFSPIVKVNSSKPSTGTNVIGLEVKDKTGQTGTGRSVIIVTK